jgi:UDP-glucose 4-epimerase
MKKFNKILVTGGLGFIGSKLVQKLIDKNYKVTVLDNLSTGKKKNLSKKYFNKIKFLNDSILNEKLLKKEIRNNDYIYHLAAAVGVKYILLNPLLSMNTNVKGTEIVLKYCSIFKKKVLIASSSEVYGLNDKNKFNENDIHVIGNSHIFRWSYAACKLVDEFYANAYSLEKKNKICIVRFFNTVGPGQSERYGMVIPRFVKAAISNSNLNVYGNGKQNRTFLHVSDATDALIKLMEKKKFGTFNLGGTENIKIIDLAKKIIKLTKSKSKIKLINYNQAYDLSINLKKNYQDIMKRHPDIKKIKKEIKFSPLKKLDDIILDIFNYSK